MNVMPYNKRQRWLLKEIKSEKFVDVLNYHFVRLYAGETGAKYIPSTWGAGWCRLLSSDLRKMHKAGLLKCHRTGLSSGAWQPGFPKWVNSYSLSEAGFEALESDQSQSDARSSHD